MSRYSGPQGKGAARKNKALKRAEAETRQKAYADVFDEASREWLDTYNQACRLGALLGLEEESD